MKQPLMLTFSSEDEVKMKMKLTGCSNDLN